jgi:hypothetical protein
MWHNRFDEWVGNDEFAGYPVCRQEPLPVPAKIDSELGRMFDHGVTRPLCVLPICAAVLRDVTVLWPVPQPVHPTGRAPWQLPRRSPTVSRWREPATSQDENHLADGFTVRNLPFRRISVYTSVEGDDTLDLYEDCVHARSAKTAACWCGPICTSRGGRTVWPTTRQRNRST